MTSRTIRVGDMAKKRVTLVTCAQYPNLSEDEAGLVDELNSRGVDARIAIWNDPHVDWEEAGVCVILPCEITPLTVKSSCSGRTRYLAC